MLGLTQSNLEPTETQKLKLENAQLKAAMASVALQQSQAQYQQRVQEFFAVCEQVKKENQWDQAARCDIQTLKFSLPANPDSTKDKKEQQKK